MTWQGLHGRIGGMKLELIRECEVLQSQHHDGEPCEHRGLVKVTRDDDSVRWLVDPEAGRGHALALGGMLLDRNEYGIVDTSGTAFYAALAVLAL